MAFGIIVVIQLCVNLVSGYVLRPNQIRVFKVLAAALFPMTVLTLPIIGIFKIMMDIMKIEDTESISIGIIGPPLPAYWMIQMLAVLVIQLLYNKLLLNRLRPLEE